MPPAVSVIVPVYQGEAHLERCLASLAAQTRRDLEIIVVDDGSTDGTAKIIAAFAARDGRFVSLRQENRGAAAARNRGLSAASGSAVVFVDADDYVAPAFVAELLAVAGEADAVAPLACLFLYDPGEPPRRVPLFERRRLNIADPQRYAVEILLGQGRNWAVTKGALYRREIIMRHKVTFPEGYTAEDVVFNLRYFQHVRTLTLSENLHYIYHVRAGSVSRRATPGLMEAFLFIDREARHFIAATLPGDERAETARRSLLCRNLVVYLHHLIGYNKGGSLGAHYCAARPVLEHPAVREALAGRRFITPYWPSPFKRFYAVLLRLLFKHRLDRVALLIITAATRLSGPPPAGQNDCSR